VRKAFSSPRTEITGRSVLASMKDRDVHLLLSGACSMMKHQAALDILRFYPPKRRAHQL